MFHVLNTYIVNIVFICVYKNEISRYPISYNSLKSESKSSAIQKITFRETELQFSKLSRKPLSTDQHIQTELIEFITLVTFFNGINKSFAFFFVENKTLVQKNKEVTALVDFDSFTVKKRNNMKSNNKIRMCKKNDTI